MSEHKTVHFFVMRMFFLLTFFSIDEGMPSAPLEFIPCFMRDGNDKLRHCLSQKTVDSFSNLQYICRLIVKPFRVNHCSSGLSAKQEVR